MTLPPELGTYLSVALFIFGAYSFALYIGLVVWTFRDIHSRSRDLFAHIMAVILVALFTLPGLVVYLLLRPQTTLTEEYERQLAEETMLRDLDEERFCPACERRIAPDFVICPHCHHQLRLRCVGCGRLLSPRWDVCPYCGLYREQDIESEEETLDQGEAPSAGDEGGEAVAEEQGYLAYDTSFQEGAQDEHTLASP